MKKPKPEILPYAITRVLPFAGSVDSVTGKITFAESWARAVQSQIKNPIPLFKGDRR